MQRTSLLILLSALCLAPVWANELKIGFVNTDRIFRESQLAIRAQKKLEREFTGREQEIQKQIKQARDLQAFLEKEGLTLSEAERSRRERELANLNRDIQRAQREFREDLNQRRNEEFAQVHERARKAIMELAEREKFDLILENVVYASPRVDITDRVIRALDK
ncbi:MAG: OmpH family outer membrane protein [Thiobacillaceae bacterium]|nr:OmpH family outer membrane protein [Thiobacillaceae bacterium]MCX7673974.1 OmpH family outer membrane protein [Thiobacillaceae bacterium]MDW8322798.1 OmpH family outer membrane protein [Burkholderiales bacterium]